MTAIIGKAGASGLSGETNPLLTTDTASWTDPYAWTPLLFSGLGSNAAKGSYSAWIIIQPNRWQFAPAKMGASYKLDFYNRVIVSPPSIDLGTVASTQTRTLVLWNAYTDQIATLNSINISDPTGITITGQAAPYAMSPNQELTYTVTIGTSGAATINTDIAFDFSDVIDPVPVHISGSRAIKFDIVPEVPVQEDWEWLTDVEVAVNGVEQRIAMRGAMPRITQTIKVLFDINGDVRRMISELLTAVGRLWIPQFQYAVQTTQAVAAGTNKLFFNPANTDCRVGEYLMLQTPAGVTALVLISTINVDGVTLSANLALDVPLRTVVVPGCSSLLPDAQSVERYAVDDVGSVNLIARMLWTRTSLVNSGHTAVSLPTFLGYPILDKRPSADDNIKDAASTGQQDLDGETGQLDIVSRWTYSRWGGDREWLVQRSQDPTKMDYWKTFFDYCRGQCKVFWMPSFRKDFLPMSTVATGANTFALDGTDYAENFYNVPTHRYLRITTAAGVQDVTVTNAGSQNGLSFITFTPALPTGTGWNQVQYVSFMLPCRLSDDKVTWKHYGMYSTVDASIRTAEV